MNEENLLQRITDVSNNVRLSDLQGFCRHSKRQIVKCYNKANFQLPAYFNKHFIYTYMKLYFFKRQNDNHLLTNGHLFFKRDKIYQPHSIEF